MINRFLMIRDPLRAFLKAPYAPECQPGLGALCPQGDQANIPRRVRTVVLSHKGADVGTRAFRCRSGRGVNIGPMVGLHPQTLYIRLCSQNSKDHRACNNNLNRGLVVEDRHAARDSTSLPLSPLMARFYSNHIPTLTP